MEESMRNEVYGGGPLAICRRCHALVPLQREAQHEQWHTPKPPPGPDPDGGVELTDKEYDAYLRAARGT